MKDKPVILIVDDQPQGIELLEAHLVPQGYEIVKAASGKEALEKLSSNQIDLILMDILMPDMDGFEVTRRIRQDKTHRPIPIILITALQETEDRVKGIEAGCDDFLSKPFDKMELLARVRSLLRIKTYNDLMSAYQMELEATITSRTEELRHAVENLQQEVIQHKKTEQALRESEELFRSYLEYAPDGVYMNDLEGNFLYGNLKCEDMIGLRSEDIIGKNFLELNILPEKSLNKAIQLLQANIEGKSTGPDEIELVGKEGRITPVEINTSVIHKMGQRVVLAFVRDITDRKRSEEKLEQTLESLRKALNTTIQVLVSAVEIRDPYTAGHQRRVADLSCAIAGEMGFTEDRIAGLHMAGAIHDIGKLSVPSEILAKPGRLTPIEFALIKEHPRSGYEMLKEVESPWPLAEVVYQHHERMDGSGYPRGLKGEEILMEARIMAVADVVESMASHRPYRQALGIKAALEEIEKNKGILYDETVTDACLRLFREKGFHLKEV